jgi:hypothetical protein
LSVTVSVANGSWPRSLGGWVQYQPGPQMACRPTHPRRLSYKTLASPSSPPPSTASSHLTETNRGKPTRELHPARDGEEEGAVSECVGQAPSLSRRQPPQ